MGSVNHVVVSPPTQIGLRAWKLLKRFEVNAPTSTCQGVDLQQKPLEVRVLANDGSVIDEAQAQDLGLELEAEGLELRDGYTVRASSVGDFTVTASLGPPFNLTAALPVAVPRDSRNPGQQ